MMLTNFNYRCRADLQAELVDAFSAQNEIYRIGLFGREAEGKQDQYSDIDLILY
jgi:predicted nucleotidyltransferase